MNELTILSLYFAQKEMTRIIRSLPSIPFVLICEANMVRKIVGVKR